MASTPLAAGPGPADAGAWVSDGHLEHRDRFTVETGDLDQTGNFKVRQFVGLALAPVFADMAPTLGYAEMGKRGIAPGQYFQDFQSVHRPTGYGKDIERRIRIGLRRSTAEERRDPAGAPRRVERLIVETRTELIACQALGPPESIGFEPPLGDAVTAATGRVLHVLTRPAAPAGERQVKDAPEELAFLAEQPLDGPYPTIELLSALGDGFAEADTGGFTAPPGIWGIANTDAFHHVGAREYLYGMESRVIALMAAAGLPVERYYTHRARTIFRKPGFAGERFDLKCRFYRQGDETVAIGAYHKVADDDAVEEKPAVFTRFEGGF